MKLDHLLWVGVGRLQGLDYDNQLHLHCPQTHTKTQKNRRIFNHSCDTVSHILNRCTKLQRLYQQRDNRILYIIFK